MLACKASARLSCLAPAPILFSMPKASPGSEQSQSHASSKTNAPSLKRYQVCLLARLPPRLCSSANPRPGMPSVQKAQAGESLVSVPRSARHRPALSLEMVSARPSHCRSRVNEPPSPSCPPTRSLASDAKRPSCSTCVRSHAYAVAHAVEGAVFPEHPECTYDEGALLIRFLSMNERC